MQAVQAVQAETQAQELQAAQAKTLQQAVQAAQPMQAGLSVT